MQDDRPDHKSPPETVGARISDCLVRGVIGDICSV